MSNLTILGVMSGSSLDGVDLAACHFYKAENGGYHYEVIAAETHSYSKDWITRLSKADENNFLDGIRLDQDYGCYLARIINEFQLRQGIKADLISCHGHTIYHNAQEKVTFQLGNGPAIWAKTQIPVITEFRQADLHLGGQGAPLVPIGDELLFGDYDYCLNLGGIVNISYKARDGDRVAFDLAPCNQVMNHLAGQDGLDYDENGLLASQGQVREELLEQLDSIAFYQKQGPRSLDKADIQREWLPILDRWSFSGADKLATFTEHLASQLVKTVAHPNSNDSILITGGGAFNDHLIQRIKGLWEGQVCIPNSLLVNFKEAVVFALMGWQCWHREINCLKSVTGASQDHIAGSIYG